MAIVISFVGILFIVQPEFLFGTHDDINLWCCLVVLIGAVINSLGIVLIRLLRSVVSNDMVLQYFYLGQTLTSGLIMVTQGNTLLHDEPLTWRFVWIMILLIIFAYLAQLFIIRAVFLIPASRVMPFNYLLVMLSFSIDVLVYHQSFNRMAIAGILVVCLSLLYIIKTSMGPQPPKPEPSSLKN